MSWRHTSLLCKCAVQPLTSWDTSHGSRMHRGLGRPRTWVLPSREPVRNDLYSYLVKISRHLKKKLLTMIIHENCALLPYYAACSGNSLPTFRDNLSVPSSVFLILNDAHFSSISRRKPEISEVYMLKVAVFCVTFSNADEFLTTSMNSYLSFTLLLYNPFPPSLPGMCQADEALTKWLWKHQGCVHHTFH